ncbi:MAG: tRNA glutamyl-Q(34) synthetase GluQRS [Gammaproteobacteria bacterium]|nr:tRNA glutamyl-Q(34) synthetase GluQRS [Gammaproteobacteria bacterium]
MIVSAVLPSTNVYQGRFAPSPTGPLHFGSLIAAVGSYLQARSRGGQWLMRMENVDEPRSIPGIDRHILDTLTHFGMEWDGPVIYQNQRITAYMEVLESLLARGLAFPCGCSRRDLGGSVYPGTCRNGLRPGKKPRSIRARCPEKEIQFRDGIQGDFSQQLEKEVGDFIVRRADGLIAYQLAVVVDDAEQGVSEVVRGSDLLDSTPRQIYLQRLLGLPTPDYIHLPVAVNRDERKLSKQTYAAPVDPSAPVPVLCQVLKFLGQCPPDELAEASLTEYWEWAICHWNLASVPRQKTLQVNTTATGDVCTVVDFSSGQSYRHPDSRCLPTSS